jgi:hypothetical protein
MITTPNPQPITHQEYLEWEEQQRILNFRSIMNNESFSTYSFIKLNLLLVTRLFTPIVRSDRYF